MKNFWLEAKMKGLCPRCGEYEWPMNTETILMQGDPMCACNRNQCNLESYYSSQFVQNETLQWLSTYNDKTIYQVVHTPILAGTMTGTVYVDEKAFLFCLSAGGMFVSTPTGPIDNYKTNLNLVTGEFELHHNCNIVPKVIVSYEYNYG